MARILVIDDDELVRLTVKQMLDAAGHQVVVAADGADGLRAFREAPADLVLCDVFMPNKSGIAALTELRQGSAVPIIVMSGGAPSSGRVGERAFVDYLRVARSLGATATIQKPFTMRQLQPLVDKCLKA